MTQDGPTRVVLGVDVLVRAVWRAEERGVLEAWRDGRIVPVLHRPLLRRYLAAFQKMGLDEAVVRGWAAWLTSPERVVYFPEGGEGEGKGKTLAELYEEAKKLGGAEMILTAGGNEKKTS